MERGVRKKASGSCCGFQQQSDWFLPVPVDVPGGADLSGLGLLQMAQAKDLSSFPVGRP